MNLLGLISVFLVIFYLLYLLRMAVLPYPWSAIDWFGDITCSGMYRNDLGLS